MVQFFDWWKSLPPLTRQILVGISGGVVVIAGVAMLILPGPGWLTIFLGIGLLGTEFPVARRWSDWIKREVSQFVTWLKHLLLGQSLDESASSISRVKVCCRHRSGHPLDVGSPVPTFVAAIYSAAGLVANDESTTEDVIYHLLQRFESGHSQTT